MITRTILRAGVLAASLVPAARILPAQSPAATAVTAGQPGWVRHGKWLVLAGAVAATVAGVRAHESGDDTFETLRTFCGTGAPCLLGSDGRYRDAQAERLYQEVLSHDRAARTWLTTGQVALAGSVVLFILDLRGRGRPENEPFNGLIVAPGVGGTARVGWRLALPHRAL